jgi:hypothetical protein
VYVLGRQRFGRKFSWPISRYHSGIYLKRIGEWRAETGKAYNMATILIRHLWTT